MIMVPMFFYRKGKTMSSQFNQNAHEHCIVEQFTKQAIPFAQLSGHADSMQLLINMSGVDSEDEVLDVACGPGMVACEFAKIAHHVTGIDITEKMIVQAEKRQKELQRTNMTWLVGQAIPLPYEDNSFSMVITRYSFHHFLEPKKALAEMIRVCRPGGTILIADVAISSMQVDAYNQMEKLRDPSHTRALSHEEWVQILNSSELEELRKAEYRVDMELESQLQASFPQEGDVEKIRGIFRRDVKTNELGVDSRIIEDAIHFSYPISIFVGKKGKRISEA